MRLNKDLTNFRKKLDAIRCGIVISEKLRPITRSLNSQKLHGLEGMNHIVDYITSNRVNTSETIE
ncbi:hypothetical protein IMM1_31810 [Pseudocoprococcus immobilis]